MTGLDATTGLDSTTELALVGISEDGAHLLLAHADGERFRVRATDELRRAVRQATSMAASAAPEPATASPTLSPREIQQRLRAGLTPQELSEISGESLDAIEKFAAPVLAERQYVIDQARVTRIGRGGGAPLLEDLVLDRLAARGARPEDISWEAWRSLDEPWRVCVDFAAGGRTSRAVWTYDHTARSLTAEDEEARWLTETELLDAPIPRRHLSAVRPEPEPSPATRPPTRPGTDRVVSDGAPPSAAIPMPEPSSLSPTEALLEELDGRRGTRESMDLGEDVDDDGEVFEGFGPTRTSRTADVAFGAPGTPAGESDAEAAPTTAHPAAASHPSAAANPGAERKGKRGRAPVPSWDEIVFGARQQSTE